MCQSLDHCCFSSGVFSDVHCQQIDATATSEHRGTVHHGSPVTLYTSSSCHAMVGYNYHIQSNKRTVRLKKYWSMKKFQGICSYIHTLKLVSLDNKVAIIMDPAD